ncbi:MAG: hypothetical protein HYU64_12130 [Armatimonadetes bacterium]|nr:hypothetical protein [Armatimonadota bacterium]
MKLVHRIFENVEKLINGKMEKVLAVDRNQNGVHDSEDVIILQDKDNNGKITPDEMLALSSKAKIEELDKDHDRILRKSELEGSGIVFWLDADNDGAISAKDETGSINWLFNNGMTGTRIDLDKMVLEVKSDPDLVAVENDSRKEIREKFFIEDDA